MNPTWRNCTYCKLLVLTTGSAKPAGPTINLVISQESPVTKKYVTVDDLPGHIRDRLKGFRPTTTRLGTSGGKEE